ncbi:protein split ends isoform X4 [Aedes aegypti]|uniref:Protein split ends n=1 Tax=Aedes aegypti TaxID=7159 RepID=A0A6I8TI48_AEDAE|nr:protein split ends isoform X4 [Aedes aegypti]
MVRETRHLWVGNLPETVREDRIREHFKRYGRVQSVRIITSQAYNPTSLSSSAAESASSKDQQLLHGDGSNTFNGPNLLDVDGSGGSASAVAASSSTSCTSSSSFAPVSSSASSSTPLSTSAAGSAVDFNTINSTSSSNNSGSHKNIPPSLLGSGGGNGLVISVCATIAFMDIRSASKAHTAEHKFDDRILTTEYYEPSLLTMPPTVAPSTLSGGSVNNCSTTTPGDSNCNSASSTTMPKHGSGTNDGSNSANSAGNSIQYPCPPSSGAGFHPGSATGSCPNSSISKCEPSGSKLLGLSDEHGSFYECSNGNSTSSSGSSSSRPASFNRLQGSSDEHGRRMSSSCGSGAGGYSRDLLEGGVGCGSVVASGRGRQRDRQHYRNGPYATTTLADRSNPISHHRLSSSSWYNSANNSNTGSGDNLSISHQQQQQPTGLSPAPLTPTRSVYSAVVQPDHPNKQSTSTAATNPQAATSSSAVPTHNNPITNNNSYDQSFLVKKKHSSRSSDSGSPQPQQQPSTHYHHHQHLQHHSSRNTSPISSTHHPAHHHHHHPSGGHLHNHIGHSSQQQTHNSRSDRSNSRSRSRSPSSSCSSTHSTTTSQSNETCSTTRSPAILAQGVTLNSGGPLFGSCREGRSDRLDRDPAARGGLQSAVTVSNNNGGGSSGASTSSGSGGGSLNCHSDDNRPLAICVRNLPARSSDTSLKDGLFHEYKKHGKVTWVKVVGQSTDRYALVCFKKPEDVEKALEVSHDKLFFGCKIEVAPYQGYDVDDNEFRPYEAELDEYHPKSTRTLFIGNLEKDITASELRKHFDCFGEIIEIDIKKQGVSAYAFCQYSDIISVVKAMRKMDGEHLGSNRIKLGFGKSMPTNCVWIDGIADAVGEGYLRSQFDRFGAVSQVTIDRERKLALVFFEQVQCAQTAVKEMRGATLRGRKLQVDFASRECQDAFFDKLDKQSCASFGSPRFESGAGGRFSGNRFLENSGRSRATSFSRPGNPLSHSGAVSPRLDPSPVSSSRGGGSSSSRSRIVRYSNDEYYPDATNAHGSGSERRFRNYDEYSQGSAASSHEDVYEHDGYSGSHVRSSAHDRLQPSSTSDSPPPTVTSSGLSSSIQSRLGDVEPTVGLSRKRSEKSPGDIRYLQKERVHILEQLEECPSSGDELVSPKKRIKYNPDAHLVSDPSDHHHPHYSSTVANSAAAASDSTSGLCGDPVMSSSSGRGGGVSSGEHHHYNSSSNNSNHYNNHHHHHHHNSADSGGLQSGFSTSSSTSHHRKCVEVRRLSDCNLQQSKSLSSQSTPSSMHSNNNSRRPSTDNASLHQRHGSSSSNSSSSLQQSHLDSGHLYSHSLNKRRKTILNSDNSMTVIASAGSTSVSSNEHHHSSRGRGHQLHSLHSHEASGGESADGSRPGTPLCDERPENLPPSEPRRIPTSRSYNQEPLSLPLPRFAIQFLQQYRSQASSSVPAISSHSSSNVALPSSSLHQSTSSSSSSNSAAAPFSNVTAASSSTSTLSTQQQSALSSLHAASSSGAISGPSLSSNSSLLTNALSSPPPTNPSKLSLLIPPNIGSSSSSTTGNTPASAGTSNSMEHVNQAPASPLRAPSVSSNSSDSEGGPSTSPTLEERINRLDEMYEKWSGNSQTRIINALGEHHFNDRHHNHHHLYHHNHASTTGGSLNQSPLSNVSSSSTSSFRHKFLELDVHEVPPSDIVKSVLSRKSIFDEDLKRLENISDKYEPGMFTGYTKNPASFNTVSANSSAAASPVNTILASQSPLHALKAQTPPAPSLQRLGSCSTSGSPMNSPQPYNSPNPSVKSGLQYPFPSHPPSMPSVAVPSSTSLTASVTLSIASTVTSVAGSTNSGTILASATTSSGSLSASASSSPTHSTASSTPGSCATPSSLPSTATINTSSSTVSSLSCSSLATLANKPKTNILNKSISLTEKSSTNISSNNNNNLTSNSSNLASTSGSSNTSVNESSALVASTTATATTTSIPTPKVSSVISSSSSSSSSTETVASSTTVIASSTESSATEASTSASTSSNTSKNSTVTAAPPGSTNSGTVRSNSMSQLSTSTSTDGVQQHSNSSNTNSGIDNSSNSGNEKEEKPNNNNSGSKHHKDRRKLSTASSCSTSSTGSSTPTASSNVPLPPEPKTGAASSTDDDQSQHQISGKHNKSIKSNNHHGHGHGHGHGHRHSSDSSSSSSSTSTKNHNKSGTDDLNEFDRLKREVPVNTINSRNNSSNRKEKERQEREEKERKLEEERIQKEKEEMRRAQELKEKELEEQRRKEKELEEQRRKEKELEDQRRKEKELEEQRRKEREEAERREREEHERQLQREQELEKERQLQVEREEREKAEREKWQKQEEARMAKESLKNEFESCDSFTNDHGSDRIDRVNSTDSNSPSQATSKRRHSSQDSNDSPAEDANAMKKHKHNNIGERRDSGKDGKREKHHKSHNRSDKSSKSSSGSSTSSDKVHSHVNALCSVGKHDNHDEKQQFLLEERRKEISFSTDGDSMQLSHHPKKKDRYHEKHKSKKDRDASRDKENTQNANFPMDYIDHRSTSDEDEHARLQHRKERKSSKDYSRRFHGESGEEYKKYDRKLSRAESSADEEGRRKKNQTSNIRTKTTNSSDTDDSDEPKKHSIFDIPDDGPNISMYDKVKARSCKNMQRQEEEKKIKAKFSKLKQSRAKREGKNRSKSWDEDSDTDGMNSDTTINSKYNHKDHLNKSGTITTSEDDDHLPSTPRMRRPKEPLATDSEEESNRIRSNRDRLNDLCDDESSDGDHASKRPPRTPRRHSDEKKMSRKNSTRIHSETDSDGHHSVVRKTPTTPNCESKPEPSDVQMDHITIKQEMKSEEDTQEGVSKVEIKMETRVQPPSALVTSDVSEDEDVSKPIIKSELIPSTMIKREPIDEGFNVVKNRYADVSSEGEPNMITVANAEIENTVNSAVDQLMYGHSEGKKRHKKKQKRHKNVEGSETDVKSEKEHSPHDDACSANSMFDELKKSSDDQIYVSSKKRHGGKKEKRRERSKEDHEKSGKSKKSKNKHKDSNKISDAMTTNVKREEKIEDIFGPISDEESQHSSVETEVSVKQEPSDVKTEDTAKLEELSNECEQTEREKNKEESRKKKEKKRREREKLRATITMKEEENSVDMDEAGRALEAQLMSDSDQKAEDASPTSTVTTSGKRSSVDVMDVFRFTDGDDSMETSFTEKKESEHGRKEKKKKKKRGKDEKHKHHHGSNNHTNPPTTTPITPTANKLSLDIISAQQEDNKHSISKPSPSLPCLLDESPPASNSSQPTQSMYASTPSRQLLSPTPTVHEMASSTPTKDEIESAPTSVKEESAQSKPVDSSQAKRKPDKLIPGFGTDIDEQLHEKAVLSISGEFITEKVNKKEAKSTDPVDSLKNKSEEVKLEEKSRVVISQEETEDAVAALLGESFGTSNTQDFSIDYSEDPVEESSSQLASDSQQIPEEDNEEIKKAILSLNTEGLDMKPDTPTSEHDLQIDTDTEDQIDDEHPASLLRFDNPPKTPDVDLSQIGKPLSDTLNSSSSAPNSAKKDDKLEVPDTPGKNVPIVTSSPSTSTSQSTSISTAIVSTTTTSAPIASIAPAIATTSVASTPQPPVVAPVPAIIDQQKMLPSAISSGVQETHTKLVNTTPPVTKQISVTTSPALPVQSKPTPVVIQKTTVVNQPPMVGNLPQIRPQVVMQAPPTITIPEQHAVYQTMDAMMSPRGLCGNDPRMQSPKLQHQPLSPFSRTSSPTATSPNLLRPQVMIQNRQPAQLSPVVGPHQMAVHSPGSHVVVSSPSPTNQSVPKPVQMVQSGSTPSRFPVAMGQVKTPPLLQKPNEQPQLAKPNLATFTNLGMASGVRVVTTSTSSMPTLGNENPPISTVGTKPVVSTTPMPVSTGYVIHPNTKPLDSVPKAPPGTPTKTIIHQQPVYLQHPIKQFMPQQPVSQMGMSQQPNRLSQPVLTPVSNVIIAKPQDSKSQNTISTITSNPNHQVLPSGMSLQSDNPLSVAKSSSDKLVEPKDKLSSLDEKDRALPTGLASTVLHQPVMKLETPAPIDESARSLLTEENVAKIPDNSSVSSVLDIDPEDQEADSKEDSDYWSSKDTIIDSVIKKVDALCSEDDISEGGSEINKEEWNKADDKAKTVEKAPLLNVLSTSGTQGLELPKAEEKKLEPTTCISTIPSTIPVPLTPIVTMAQTPSSASEPITTSPEDDDTETRSTESTPPNRGGKRGGRRGGRKTSESLSTPVKPLVPEKMPEMDLGTPSKRGGKAGSKRSRGAARGGAVRGGASNVQPLVMAGGKGKHASTGSDVYEFHDDSGEEVTGSDKQQADGSRPRLILTIKGTTASPTPSTSTAPVVVTSAPIILPTMTTVGTISTPSAQLQPTTSCPAPQPPLEMQTIPAPAVDASKEEFIHPTSGNTRKSRRLLEKDGRTTVDDIIDDVIRNGPSSCVMPSVPAQLPSQPPTQMILQQFQPQHVVNQVNQIMSPAQPQIVQMQQHPTGPNDLPGPAGRRNARHNATPANAMGPDARKSPRAPRKGKDRKISETSNDSNDERSMSLPRPGQMDGKVEEASVSGTLSATTPITPSVSVTRPNEMASLADKSKEKPKSADDVKMELDPATGELTVTRPGKEGQYLVMPNAPQPLKKVIAAAANAAQNAVEHLKSSPTPPISASASPIPNRTPTPGSAPSPGMTRVPTPNTMVNPHPTQQMEAQKLSAATLAKQSTQLPSNIPAPTGIVPSPHGNPGAVLIQHTVGQGMPQPPTILQQGPHNKPHSLKAHVLSSQQIISQHPQPGKPIYPPSTQSQPQIVYKSVIPQQPGSVSGAIHTTTGKQIHPSTNMKLPPQGMPTQGISQHPGPQQIIIQNPMPQQQMTINKHTIINKAGPPQQQGHPSAVHHPPGSGNLLINIPPNLQQMGNIPMSPRMPHHVVVTNSKGQPGQMQSQQSHSPQIIHKQTNQPPQPGQQGPPGGPQQIIIHSSKAPPGHHQIPAGYTTVLQTGGKIIHQGPVQLAGPGQPQQPQPGILGKQQTQTIQISSASGVPIHYQQQPIQSQPTVVHKTVTTVHGNQHIKIQQHKVGPEAVGHMHVGGKHPVGSVGTKIPLQQQQQMQPVGMMKPNHITTGPVATISVNQQQQQTAPPPSPSQLVTIQPGKGVSPHLHAQPQILTGAVASPPLKQPHMQSQQPIVTGASSSRVALPPISPQGQPGQQPPPPASHMRHVQQPGGLIVPSQVTYESNQHGDLVAGFIARGQSPPPAHQQQTSPITPNDPSFRGGMPREYTKYMYSRGNIHIPSRSPMLPGSVDQRELSEMEESVAASPPLELRRPASGPRVQVTTAVPSSLQSPGDRSTDSPQVAQVYIGSARVPHNYSDSLTRFYDPAAGPNAPPRALSAEPPPAHRPHSLINTGAGFPPGSYPGTPSQTPPPASPANLAQIQQQRDQQQQSQQQQQQRDRVTLTGHAAVAPVSGAPLPAHSGSLPASLSQQQPQSQPQQQPPPAAAGRNLQAATPPIGGAAAAQMPSAGPPAPAQSDSLEALLQRYPVMWQGLLALKNDQAAVQMHFVHGNPGVAGSSLPSNSDGTTPPLRIAQRMRLEPAQIDGVARKMQMDQEHCMLLALPCGRDRMDVLQQQNNLQTGFITYLQQKQAAGIVNIAAPGSSQAAYVVHIFPSCEFANENLARIAPDLMHRVANIQYLLIVIATV